MAKERLYSEPPEIRSNIGYREIKAIVRKGFRKRRGILKRPKPTVLEEKLFEVAMPLYEACAAGEFSSNELRKAISYLHPSYRFTTAAPTILKIAELIRARNKGLIDNNKIPLLMENLNTRNYELSKEYYKAVALEVDGSISKLK